MLRILFKVNRNIDLDFSATYGYRQRINYPDPGTQALDAFKIAKEGATLNALMPSDLLTEEDMNSAKISQYHRDVAADFKLPYYVQIDAGNFDKVASVIQTTKKGVMVWFYFTEEEWSRLRKRRSQGIEKTPAHCSAISHKSILFSGAKGITIHRRSRQYRRFC